MKSDPNSPTFICDEYSCHWQMTRIEKIAFHALVKKISPENALEIGTYKGGSLQILSEFSEHVYSVDISDEPKKALEAGYGNVSFIVGDSKKLLPEFLADMKKQGKTLDFILIDGDHSENGVRTDINNILRHYVPESELFLVCHDSFNPSCRKGIVGADWADCPYVDTVEVDFVPGVYHYEAFDTAKPKSMWGGLAVARLLPEQRQGKLTVHQSQKGLFDAVYKDSIS